MPPTQSCSNCGAPFGHTNRPHHTFFEEGRFTDGRSCYPLCEDCWSTLTPETRAPFYWRHILDARIEQPVALAIMKAVEEGK